MIVTFYIAAIVVANLLVAWLGPWFSPINALVLIGMDLSLRDHLHEKWDGNKFWIRMIALIAVASAISYVLNPATGQIALASLVAFSASALVDTAVYKLLHRRSWIVKSNGSNVAGSLVDSLVFPTIAFGAFMPVVVLLQFLAKVAGGAVWTWVLSKIKTHNQSVKTQPGATS